MCEREEDAERTNGIRGSGELDMDQPGMKEFNKYLCGVKCKKERVRCEGRGGLI